MPKVREEAAAPDGAAAKVGGYAIRRYGRYWAVIDSAGALVCVTVYKRGASEVVRRLAQ